MRSTTSRGYGWVHQRLRKAWAPRVSMGGIRCARCKNLIIPGERWDLGHDDDDRSIWTGPEHRRCNRAAGARKATEARMRNKPPRRTSEAW